MKYYFTVFYLYFLSFFGSTAGLTAQTSNFYQLSENTVISLITCTPGNQVYNIFGHSAIRIFEPETNRNEVYNYGTFDFDQPNFIWKFITRTVQYKLSKVSFKYFMKELQAEHRGVSEQILKLNQQQRQKLFEYLETNYLPQNREYLYDFFYDNCATRIRDVMNKGIAEVKIKDVPSKKRFRDFLDEYLQHDPWLNFGIYLILGLEADKICTYNFQMFLPDYLSSNLGKSTMNNAPLLEEAEWLLPKPEPNKYKGGFFTPIVFTFSLLSLGLGIIFGLHKKIVLVNIWEISFYTVMGLVGVFLLFMWFGTDHIATQKNLNILWANPLYLIWIFIGFRKKITKFVLYMGYLLFVSNIIAILIFVFPLQQFNFAVLPIILLMIVQLGNRLFIKKLN
jgi:hypothetical protein